MTAPLTLPSRSIVVTDSIPGSRRQIDQEKIQILPFDTPEELIDELILVGIAPDNGIIRILQQERHGRDLQIVRLEGNDPARRADLELLTFGADHLGNIGAVNVHVTDTDMPSLERQAHREIGGARALSDPALIAHDEDFVLDALHPLGYQPAAMSFLVLLTGSFSSQIAHAHI